MTMRDRDIHLSPYPCRVLYAVHILHACVQHCCPSFASRSAHAISKRSSITVMLHGALKFPSTAAQQLAFQVFVLFSFDFI